VEVYYQPWTAVQRLYYEFHVRNGRGARMLPFVERPEEEYLGKYIMLNGIHSHLHPFCFLRNGDVAIMAGVHDGFIELGVSTLFIMSALVGPSGHVYAIDPDERNHRAIGDFTRRNGITNVTSIQKALWRERTRLEFVSFSDYSSSNMSRESFERKASDQEILWGKKRRERKSETTIVQADTIDNIIADDIERPVRFVNLTINGAEAEALKGADTFLRQKDMMVSFPLQELSSPLYPILKSYQLNLVVGDAPTKAWEGRQFLYGTAGHWDSGDLVSKGFVQAFLESDPAFPNRFHVMNTQGKLLEPVRGNE
jgi:FkbM family methyltransferase